jgi:polar amino acid transport system permease protein
LKFEIVLDNLPYILSAAGVTLKVTALSFFIALWLALIVGTIRSEENIFRPVRAILSAYIEIFRGTPLLIQLFFIYYGLPTIGINLSNFTAAIAGLSLNSAAYMSEIIRAGLLSVDSSQKDAAYVLGYSKFQTFLFIIYPQAVRVVIPPLMNSFSSLLKESSLISILAITELTRSGQLIYTRTYRAFEIYLTLGVIYFVMTYIVSLITKEVEKRSSIAYKKENRNGRKTNIKNRTAEQIL